MTTEVIAVLADAVGVENVITDPDVMAAFCTDWTRRFGGPALCVVRPGNTSEVVAVLQECSRAGVPVIPQGGNTGLVGGGVPAASMAVLPVILSMNRINWIGEIDHVAGQLSCGAGATLGHVQKKAEGAGWFYGIDLAARDSATIGGTVATNAGGIRVVAYGMSRTQVVGIEAVLADGSVISHMSGLQKDNTGLDLGALLCGSEGSLAVITAVRLNLASPPLQSTVALVGVQNFEEAMNLMRSAVRPGYRLLAAEVMDSFGMELACSVTQLRHPLAEYHPLTLLLEVEDGGEAAGFDFPVGSDAVVGWDADQREKLWRYREAQADGYATLGVVHKLDVSVPLPRLSKFADQVNDFLASHSSVTHFGVFGHLGDGNLHVEFCGPAADDEVIDAAILNIVSEFDGAVSAEHGIGRHKIAFLHLSRTAAEIHAMAAIKAAWDPEGILNPGVLLPGDRASLTS